MKKGNLKLRRNISIIVLSLLFTMMFGSICHASGEGSAAKSGTYCQVVGAFTLSNTNSSKNSWHRLCPKFIWKHCIYNIKCKNL